VSELGSISEMVRNSARESELGSGLGQALESVLGLERVSGWVMTSRHRVPDTNYADQV
jgi:hypothetical protein